MKLKHENPPDLPLERIEKRDNELERIKSKTYERLLCEQYALIADEDGWFPCYSCEGSKQVYLLEGEVWKYGKTCNTKSGRYPDGLPYPNLQYVVQFVGTEEECLIAEKEKIYGYVVFAENLERSIRTGTKALLRPPGNKIDR